jgi:alkylation response protein AidB-like acyl-CoA dehydrogenase
MAAACAARRLHVEGGSSLMTTTIAAVNGATRQAPATTDWVAVARALGPGFASRAAAYDANDSFPVENYQELKEHRVFGAPVPAELGGGGASYTELCAIVRELGRHCGATALSLSMHMHLTGTMVWLWRQGAPVAPLLERIAGEQLVLITSGASDWLDSSGTAERVDGGYRITARKNFCSGSPAGDLFLTSALYEDPNDGPTALHFAVPMKALGLTVLDNWRTMAMRASGSNDIVLDGVFVPDSAISSRRPRGAWTPVFNVIGAVAAPVIMSVYLGVAEAARDLALQKIAKKRDDPDVWQLVGEMENALVTGQLAVQSTIELNADYTFAPEKATFNAMVIRKTIAAQALMTAVEKALEAVGGAGIYRATGLERLVRDIHAAQFHPLQAKRQYRFTGRMALGLDPVG